MRRAFPWIFGLLALVATGFTFVVPNAAGFQVPELARIVFFHLPCAFLCSALLIIGAYQGVKFLKNPTRRRAPYVHAALELGTLFAVLTMLTGMYFSRFQWGRWWDWDLRQTSFLVVMLMFLAAIGLRAAYQDPIKKAQAMASYLAAMVIPGLFLIFVFPRIPHIQALSLHPSQTVGGGLFDTWYRSGLILVFAVLTMATIALFRERVRLDHEALELEENLDAHNLSAGTGATDPRVVRPVVVSQDHP